MNIRKRRHHEVSVNLTPLIDVVFLLLIFFMVSTTFKKQSALAIELPEVGPGHAQAERTVTEIGIDRSGEYWFNGERLAEQSKTGLKKSLIQLPKSEPIVIVGDANAPYQAVVAAMDVAAQLGLNQIKIMAQES